MNNIQVKFMRTEKLYINVKTELSKEKLVELFKSHWNPCNENCELCKVINRKWSIE